MAILEDVPGVELTVVVNGRDAVEYEDPAPPEQEPAGCPSSSKYIECVDGAEFTIKSRITSDYEWGYRNHAVRIDFMVDGKLIRCKVSKQPNAVNGVAEQVLDGLKSYCSKTRQWMLHRFKFAAISTIDDSRKDRVESDMKVAKNLGLIEAHVYRCLYLGSRSSSTGRSRDGGTDKFSLAEKSLKGRALSHGTSFAPGGLLTDPLDALKQEMVIPRTPSPDPAAPLGVAGMSRAELEHLAQERLGQLRGGGGVKRERKPIKREIDLTGESDVPSRPPKLSRRSPGAPPEVIDLTSD
ncbi:hypothetical protein AAE478_003917 [Parahypoxylon ruwenzoriense]